MKHQAAIARARAKFASGGALPKADKGDFKQADVLRQMVRAVQDYWLSDTYADPRGANVTRQAMTDPPAAPTRALKAPRADTLPAIWQGVPGFANGGVIGEEESFRQMPPVDQWNAPREAPPADPEATRARNLRDLLSIIPGPGNVIAAEDAGTAFKDASTAAGEGRYGAAAGNTALGLLSGVGAVAGLPVGRLAAGAAKGASSRTNIFAGPIAANADHAALAKAKALDAAGQSRGDIWNLTGWFKGPEGKWRFEIPDDQAVTTDLAKQTLRENTRRERTMGDFLDHPELAKAYPDSGGVPTILDKGRGTGRYWSTTDRIGLEPRSPAEMKRIALHELQHRIQRREGFAPGGDMFASAEGLEAFNTRRGELFQKMLDDPNLVGKLDDVAIYKLAGERAKNELNHHWYLRTAGEVEARNVETRANMTPDERRALPPWATQEYDDGQQIVTGQHNSPQDVFVPAGDTPDALRAQAWRAAGVPNEHVHKGTKLSFDPGGNLRREIIDFPMKIDLSKAKPGTIFPLGDVVDHPELFKTMPHLRNQPVQITSRVNEQGHSTSRTNPDTGVFELSNAVDAGGSLKGDLAKMLQYRISDEAGFPAALRHRDQGAHLDQAMKLAAESGSPHAAEYVSILDRAKQDYFKKVMEGSRQNAGNALQNKSAGNLESRHVRARATEPGDISGAYPWARNPDYMRTVGHQKPAKFGDIFPLPPESITKPDAMRAFLDKWKAFGSGKGSDPDKFATGGGVKSMVARARQKLAAGGMVGPTGGRTDAVPVAAGEGSYVIPADVVAALGEGNSVAGHKMLESRFKSTGSGKGPGVDIIVSDGEFIITPEQVAALGGGDIAYGHQVLDAFVLNTRKRNIEELSQLPGPKQ